MRLRRALGAVALGSSVALIAFAALVAWRSSERLYTAFLFRQGRIPTDDLVTARVSLRLELLAWAIVLGLALVIFFLLRFWQRSRHLAGRLAS